MAIKQKEECKSQPQLRKVRFSIEAREARAVAVVGDFNQWDQKCYCLRKKDGRWEKTFLLPPGVYEYKYLVDGQWRMDLANEQVCVNCFGTRNNVIVVASK
jgi:1,4-alpha-glucan branching enzyme